MLAADTLEALGVPRGQYVVKVNSRKILDGLMDAIRLWLENTASDSQFCVRSIS